MQQSRIDQHRRDPALHRVYVCRRSSTARGSTMPGRVSRSPAVQDYPRTSGRRGASPLRRDVPVPPPCHTTANCVIIDAARMERNAVLHVVDPGSADAAQWLMLLRLFAKRPGAGAHDQILRLTIVNEEDEFMTVIGVLLAREAESLHISFQFHSVKLHINQLLSIEPLSFRISEALVIASTLQLQHLLADEFVEVVARPHDRKGKAQAHATMMKADVLLRDLAELSPKLMVVTEQEADHNGKFMGWFDNALNYYRALSDALEESVPARVSAMERSDVEWCLLLQEIRDIVACDGAQRPRVDGEVGGADEGHWNRVYSDERRRSGTSSDSGADGDRLQ